MCSSETEMRIKGSREHVLFGERQREGERGGRRRSWGDRDEVGGGGREINREDYEKGKDSQKKKKKG